MGRLLLLAVLLVAVIGGISALAMFLGSLRARLRALPPPDPAELEPPARGLDPPRALPGWYPDPAGGTGQRWWDGLAWTDDVRPPPA